MSQDQTHIPRYFELRRRAIRIVDSVSQTTCRRCASPCCERRLCMKAIEKFDALIYLEPRADAIRRACAAPSERPLLDADGCLFSILRPAVCLAFYCDASLSGLLRTEKLCVLAIGRAFPDEEVTRYSDLRFLEYAVEVCEAVVMLGSPLSERNRRKLISRIPGLSERLELYVVS